jgi:hypothetical protein
MSGSLSSPSPIGVARTALRLSLRFSPSSLSLPESESLSESDDERPPYWSKQKGKPVIIGCEAETGLPLTVI